MSQSDDIDAINDYFSRTKAVTSEAEQLRSSFINWYINLGWFEKSTNDSVLQEAKARRTAFNAANKTPEQVVVPLTEEEQEFFQNMPTVDTSGMTPAEATQAIWTPKKGAKKPPASLASMNIPTADGSSIPSSSSVTRRTLTLTSPRMKGDDVREWQGLIGITPADGEYGSGSVKKTKDWQTSKGLVANGVVDSASWAAATNVQAPFIPATPTPTAVAARPAATKKKTTPAFADTVAEIPVKPSITEAGMIPSSLKKMPIWAWIALGITTVGSLFFAKTPNQINDKKLSEVNKKYSKPSKGKRR
jgi:peptidoglycan hydrolase-like protein with peptidoglycan-binding domain